MACPSAFAESPSESAEIPSEAATGRAAGVVHWGYRANLLPGVPARYAVHAAEGEMAALHLLLLLPHDHRLRLQRVKDAL